jgi:hypothetical protein
VNNDHEPKDDDNDEIGLAGLFLGLSRGLL